MGDVRSENKMLIGKPEGNTVGEVRVDGRMILKWSLKKYSGWV
jgi:hypothetical protein